MATALDVEAHRAHLRDEIRRLRWKVARDFGLAALFLAAAVCSLLLVR